MTNIQVTFTNDEHDVVGTMVFQEHLALFVDVDVVENICQQLRAKVNLFGDPLHFRIEYISEDLG